MDSYVLINFVYDAIYNFDYDKCDRINSFAKQNYNRKNFITFFGLYRNRMLDTFVAIGKSVVVQPVARKWYEK